MGVSQGQLVYAVVTSTSQVSVAYSTFPRNQPRALVHAIVIGSQALTDRTTITWNTAAQCNRESDRVADRVWTPKASPRKGQQSCQSHLLGQSKSATPSSKWICHVVLSGAQRAKNVKCTGKEAAISPAAVFGASDGLLDAALEQSRCPWSSVWRCARYAVIASTCMRQTEGRRSGVSTH